MAILLISCPSCGSSNLEEYSSNMVENSWGLYQNCHIKCLECGHTSPNYHLKEYEDYDVVRQLWNDHISYYSKRGLYSYDYTGY